MERKIERVIALVDDLGSPSHMSKPEWKGFLESLISEIQSRLDAVGEDMENERDE